MLQQDGDILQLLVDECTVASFLRLLKNTAYLCIDSIGCMSLGRDYLFVQPMADGASRGIEKKKIVSSNNFDWTINVYVTTVVVILATSEIHTTDISWEVKIKKLDIFKHFYFALSRMHIEYMGEVRTYKVGEVTYVHSSIEWCILPSLTLALCCSSASPICSF